MKPAAIGLIVLGFLLGLFSVFKLYFHPRGAVPTRYIWIVLLAAALAGIGLALKKVVDE